MSKIHKKYAPVFDIQIFIRYSEPFLENFDGNCDHFIRHYCYSKVSLSYPGFSNDILEIKDT